MKTLPLFLITAVMSLTTTAFSPAEEWYVFESKELGYSVEFPVKPEESIESVPSAIGNLTMNMAMYDASSDSEAENMIYLTNRTTYPDTLVHSDFKDQVEQLFQSAINGSVTNVQGKLISEKNISIDDYPGKEIKVDYLNGMAIITMQMYLVKNHMYMLETITYTKDDNNKAMDRFFGSFKLLKSE